MQMDRRWRKRWENYWLRAEQKAKRAIDALNLESGWFDFWHTHPDWQSKGNSRHEQRIYVTTLTYKLLIYTEECIHRRRNNSDIQVFATICADTSNNAIFLHTANPNNTTYPYVFDDTVWGKENIPSLECIVDLRTHETGVHKGNDGTTFYIRKKT